ncbi:hypothetical protein GEMRC1_001122 [Eukaryota sp. GEM-RC1]
MIEHTRADKSIRDLSQDLQDNYISLNRNHQAYKMAFTSLYNTMTMVSSRLERDISGSGANPLYWCQFYPGDFVNNGIYVDGKYNDSIAYYPIYELLPMTIMNLAYTSNPQKATGNLYELSENDLSKIQLNNYDTNLSLHPLYATKHVKGPNKQQVSKLMLFSESLRKQLEQVLSLRIIDYEDQVYNTLVMLRHVSMGSLYLDPVIKTSILGGTKKKETTGGALTQYGRYQQSIIESIKEHLNKNQHEQTNNRLLTTAIYKDIYNNMRIINSSDVILEEIDNERMIDLLLNINTSGSNQNLLRFCFMNSIDY